MSLHDELSRLADTAPRPSIDHTVWDRGRALRRRDRLVTSAVVLALVVIIGGLASLAIGPPRAVAPADGLVPSGAIPSRIVDLPADLTGPLEKDLAIGRVSVAYVASNSVPVVIGATDGAYSLLDLPGFSTDDPGGVALSPDGRQLAWATPDRIRIADLETGEIVVFPHNSGQGARVTSLSWQAGSALLSWQGTNAAADQVAGTLDLAGPSEFPVPIERTIATGLASPARTVAALSTASDQPDARFVRPAGPNEKDENGDFLQSDASVEVPRALPVDLYPDGAAVRPLGWAADDLVLAEIDAPAGSYVEGRHLALFTSPDRPESEWTYRIVGTEVPDVDITVAVDLVPDLDGTSSQQLTHDFGDPALPGERDISWIIGLGVAAAVAVLMGLRWLWRRRTHLF